ncbi:ABC transporter ATP-binding protein [Paenibacillus chitinolyticus]|uniref:ABC transporter ATP-binding protein n=1 Tax=Paenibacillus chitinolyticus TaxID=79263 RepID=A0A410WPL4_9BACL|nr:ABC transporter ATP-binding protein [Paenibacillus chitinolyticus]MCY9590847.1 ABC transporter ATP-binding protein [Paenibacillus chitinolyticus]MCY9598754.1 ABC transporter ATP-binding protein [Paenibacillus chitinolyticus]QAV16293.1 ABC transporter ATP-binding protein [Paenibacillus chitinolyticus]
MNEMIIQTFGLSKQYKLRSAVDNVNLQIRKGDIYGFLGPNGAGKTTTIRMLLGLIRPTKGTVQLFGKDLRKEKLAILRKVGSLVEYPSYYGHLTAYENLEAIRRILDVPKQRIDEVLAIVRLTKEAKRPVKGYSLGMKQRLGIAAALLGSPELLVLDEPTNGLDPSGILEIRELIKSMPQQYGVTVLVSSHLLSEVDQMASRVGIISGGSMIFEDTIESLRKRAGGQIRIAVDAPQQALRTVASAGCFAVADESSLLLEEAPDEKIAQVVAGLVQAGHSVYRVEEKKKSLEDFFLDLVGEGESL